MKRALTVTYTFLIIIYFELFLHIYTQNGIEGRFFISLLFAIPTSLLIVLIASLFNERTNIVVYNIIIGVISLYFASQIVYFNIFGSYISVSMFKMGATAVNDFNEQLIIGIKNSILPLICILAIIPLNFILTVKKIIPLVKKQSEHLFINVCTVIATHIVCLLIISTGSGTSYSLYDLYHSNDISTDISIKSLGVGVTTRLEIEQMLFKNINSAKAATKLEDIDVKEYNSDEYNVENIDFNSILDSCDNAEAANLCTVLAQREPTKKNEYTGYFKDYNLITICAEAFSPYLINEELTPTLYKISTNGFVFNNYYGSFDSVTTNGEYSFCMGMFPDLSRSRIDNSFIASVGNTLPYSLANQFNCIGADTFAYHNFVGTYYQRNITHPNMGYKTFKTPDNGLDIAPTWPSSDYDMIVKSVDDYIDSGNRFHTYYMTFSGHYQYDWENVMDARNKSLVKELDYSLHVKAYIAGNLELEKAMTYLTQKLEAAGIADKTVIVLTNDHYPYGLSEDEYNELAGETVDTNFGRYKNSFICYTSSMKEPISVDSCCCTIDILPTLLNLFGFEYDSRLIPGRDILSDSDKIAILSNQSFICSDFRYDVPNSRLTITSENDVLNEEINAAKLYVKDVMGISRAILNTDFYKYIRSEADEQ